MNSLYISHHPTANRALALAVFRDLRARGIDAVLNTGGADEDALSLVQTVTVVLCVITPASAPALSQASPQERELRQALAGGQAVLGLFAYGAAPTDPTIEALPEDLRAALHWMPVVAPPLSEPDALASGLEHLHGQLIALFENSSEDGSLSFNADAFHEAAQRALRLPAPTPEALLAEAWFNRALTAPDATNRLHGLNRALSLAPGMAEAHMLRGQLRLRSGDAAGAREDFDAAAQNHIDDAHLFVLRGQARRQLGDMAGAAEDFGLAIERDPDQAIAYAGRGLCRKALGHLPGALEDFNAALALSPPSAPLLINRGLARKAMAAALDSEEARPVLEAARADYDAALAIEPGSTLALNNRGVVRLQLGDVPGAVADLDAALERDPDYASARRNRAAAEEALRSAASAQDRSAAETHVSLALALAHTGLFESALEELAEALRLDPMSGSAYHARARLRAARGDSDAALEDFAQALTLDPGNALAYADRAELYFAGAQLDKAARDYTRAIRAAPGSAHYLLRRGVVRAEAADYARAIEDFSASLDRNNRQPAAYYHRGLAYAALGSFDAAVADYNAALAIEPDLAVAYLNRGLARAAHHEARATQAAIEDLKLYLVQAGGEDRAEVERILRVLESQR